MYVITFGLKKNVKHANIKTTSNQTKRRSTKMNRKAALLLLQTIVYYYSYASIPSFIAAEDETNNGVSNITAIVCKKTNQ